MKIEVIIGRGQTDFKGKSFFVLFCFVYSKKEKL